MIKGIIRRIKPNKNQKENIAFFTGYNDIYNLVITNHTPDQLEVIVRIYKNYPTSQTKGIQKEVIVKW